MVDFLNLAVSGFGLAIAALLCIAGVILSCLSLSGTWLVAAATALTVLVTDSPFPNLWTVIVFVVLSAFVEIAEIVAVAWGVKRRGGSKLAGVMAVVGGMLGLVLGTIIPVPILGSLIGMLAGSFGLVFVVERHRLKRTGEAAGIAWGAVLGRVFMIALKVCVTMGMTVYLFVGMAVQS